MIFKYFQYLSPTWYFNLKPQVDHGYFPTIDQIKGQIPDFKIDMNYQSEEARKRDAAYSAFQLGFINTTPNVSGTNIWRNYKNVPPSDEYRFLRKNFNSFWLFYVLVIRTLTLNNPIAELIGIFKSRHQHKLTYSNSAYQHSDFYSFECSLIESKPLISIIIPTLNRYKYLKDVFRDLEKQSYQNFEVIVVDQTEPFEESVYNGWNLNIKFWYQEEKALWKARNEAISSAKGDLILLYDDDSLVDPDWIEQHIRALDYFQADISSGVSISKVGAKVPDHYSFFRWSDQLDTGNAMIKKEVFNAIGPFDVKFEKQRMGDGEYGLRAYLAGYRNVSNPYAKRIHLKVGQGGLRQMGSWDGWRPKKFFSPRPVPSILYLYRKYFGKEATLWSLLKNVPPSIIPYQFKANKLLMIVGSLLSVLLAPVIAFQIWISWRKSSEMLSENS